jgi:hypothetical protein
MNHQHLNDKGYKLVAGQITEQIARLTDDYQSENVTCEFLSDATPEECEALIGKTIASIEAREYSFILHFTDSTSLTLSGGRWVGCSLGVVYDVAEED